jgi:hypothetical protein
LNEKVTSIVENPTEKSLVTQSSQSNQTKQKLDPVNQNIQEQPKVEENNINTDKNEKNIEKEEDQNKDKEDDQNAEKEDDQNADEEEDQNIEKEDDQNADKEDDQKDNEYNDNNYDADLKTTELFDGDLQKTAEY